MKTIMHTIDSLAVGGSERMLVDIANNIDPAKFRVCVCVTRSDIPLAKELHKGISVNVLNRQRAWSPSGFINLMQFSQQQKVDLYHAHGRSTFSFLVAAKTLGIISKPILFHDHFGDIDIDTSTPFWFKYWGAYKLDYYVGVSNKLGDWAKSAGVPPERIAVLPNALDTRKYTAALPIDLRRMFNIPSWQKIGVVVNNLRPSKGLDLLIEACTILKKENLPVFIVVGKTQDARYVQQCMAEIERKGLKENFIFTGLQNNSPSWIKAADFAVMPSRTESGPLTLIEYMLCGKPFAAFKVGGVSEQIHAQIPEYFASPNDTTQIARLIEQLNSSPKDELQKHGQMARTVALEMFDIRKKIPEWQSIYQSITEND